MATSTPPSGTAYPVVSAAQKQRSRSRSGLNGNADRPTGETYGGVDGRRPSHPVIRAPTRPCFAWSLVSHHTKVMTARISIECRRRAVGDSLGGAAGSASPPNLRRPGPQLKPDGKTRHPVRIAETRCTLGLRARRRRGG
jgi:hypothetical protein